MFAELMQSGSVPKAAAVLTAHPGVKAAMVCRSPGSHSGKIVAFLQPEDSYLDQALDRKKAEAGQLRVWRKTYDLTQFAKAAATAPLGFNILGWNSTYTREPFSDDDMREWIDTTVERILTLHPSEVLEIGCGTGLLLLRIAPQCAKYAGIDFSSAVLQRLREQLTQVPELRERVELHEGYADDLQQFAADSFDTIVINSIAQYFPSLSYFHRVLDQAVRLVKPGGYIFAGDQRSLPLLPAFALSVEASGAPSGVSAHQLREALTERLRNEQQLVISPSFFLSLPALHSKISRVDVYPRRGRRENEMTRFRYDAILRIGSASPDALDIKFLDSPQGEWTLDQLRTRLRGRGASSLGFARIRNSRVARDALLLTMLRDAPPDAPLAALCQDLPPAESCGIDPEALATLAAEMGYGMALSWASCHSDGSYDAAFFRRVPSGRSGPELPLAISWPPPAPADFVFHSNAPGQAEVREKFLSELAAHCRAQLSSELVPQLFYLVDSLPRGTNGVVNCEALLSAARTFELG